MSETVRTLPPPVRQIPLTDEVRALLIEHRARKQPTSLASLSDLLGVSIGTVVRWVRLIGPEANAHMRPGKSFTDEKRAELRKLWPDETISIKAMQKRWRMDRGTIQAEAYRLGLGDRPALVLPMQQPRIGTRPPATERKDVWSEERKQLLRKLWATGMSATLIGQRMGIGKSSVLGMKHRLGLPLRNAPATGDKRKPSTLTPHPPRQKGTGVLVGPTLDVVPPPPVVRPAFTVVGTVRACAWPMWGHRERSGGINARFCCEPTIAGRSYCGSHCAQAYVPARSREIANAA
jgi:GcrA cell cycle regulator